MKKTRWFIYTVLVGLIPVLARLLIWSLNTTKGMAFAFNEGDFIAFGLVLSITNINELEHEDVTVDPQWKTQAVGISVMFIVLFAVLFAASVLFSMEPQNLSIGRIKSFAAILCVATFFFCLSVFNRMTAGTRKAGTA